MAVTPPPGPDSGDAMPFGTIWAQVGEAYVVPRIQRAADATAQDPTVPQYRHP